MDRRLLVFAALGLSLAACSKSPTASSNTFNEAAAMNTPVESPAAAADNSMVDSANAAAPEADGNNTATP
jgi:hypothetical protein